MSITAISAPSQIRPAASGAVAAREAAPVRTRLRITRRGRAVLTTLIAAPLVAAIGYGMLSGGFAAASGSAGADPASFERVTVMHGETLWGIAGEVAPEADPRDVVADIAHLNNLPGGQVQAGQTIAIPTKYSQSN